MILEYNQKSTQQLPSPNGNGIHCFLDENHNINWDVVESFGEEWNRFNEFSEAYLSEAGGQYFDIVPKELFSKDTLALDVGCGTGRWTKYVCRRVGFVEALDPSEAVLAAEKVLSSESNVRITRAGVDNIPFADESFDFVFSLGVLHHIPDTKAAMKKCVSKLKPGGWFLAYLYYDFENRGVLFRSIFQVVNLLRKGICRLPQRLKNRVCDLIAAIVYFPLARICTFLSKTPVPERLWKKIPLSYYSTKSFRIMRNDSLDRFGTQLEQRFSKAKIKAMMESAGLRGVRFSPGEPYWHAIGQKPLL